ncbi:hypothetical protein JCM10213v2_008578 [Rhodosporidiobolus nylandii]
MSPHILSFPLDVLQRICRHYVALPPHEQKKEDEKPVPCRAHEVALLHRTFLPLARNVAFERVAIDDWRVVERLCLLVDSTPEVAPFVKILEFSLEQDKDGRPELLQVKGAGGPQKRDNGRPADDDLRRLLSQLKQLSRLSIDGSIRLTRLVLAEETVTSGMLPKLARLSLKETQYGWMKPCDAARFQHISLDLDVSRYDSVPVFSKPVDVVQVEKEDVKPRKLRPAPVWPLKPSHPLSLTLRGPLDAEATSNLISSFPTLSSLSLFDTSSDGSSASSSSHRFVPLLSALTQPAQLTSISLRQTAKSPLGELFKALGAFSSLTSLTLYSKTYSPAVFPTLALLPKLEHLTFTRDVAVTPPILSTILERVSSLKRLTLNNLVSGTSRKAGYWPAGYDKDVVKEMVEEAKTRGVKVDGKMVAKGERELLLEARRKQKEAEKAARKAAEEAQLEAQEDEKRHSRRLAIKALKKARGTEE